MLMSFVVLSCPAFVGIAPARNTLSIAFMALTSRCTVVPTWLPSSSILNVAMSFGSTYGYVVVVKS